MYKNKFKNNSETKFTELDLFCKTLADLDIQIELYAIGGTAMVLENIKESTKDIDFYTTAKKEDIVTILKKLHFTTLQSTNPIIAIKNDIRTDIFYGEQILGMELSDNWKTDSKKHKTYNKVILYRLNWTEVKNVT